MDIPASYSEAIDLSLDLPDWHRRYVIARTFVRAMPCIFSQPKRTRASEPPITLKHLLNLYRAALLLCVATKMGPVVVRIDSLEKLGLPGGGAKYDISISAKNAARCAVVSDRHDIRICSELCLSDSMAAVQKYRAENPGRTDTLAASRQLLTIEVAGSSDPDDLDFSAPLWPELTEFPSMDRSFSGAGLPKVHLPEDAGPDFLNTPFWHDWYWGIVSGKPLDWILQRRVAEIEDSIWKEGPEAVAAEIERIKAEFHRQPADKQRFPKHEPNSVSRLIENRVIASASLQSLAAQVARSVERFHAETGANALPEALEPISSLPGMLLAVHAALQKAPASENTSVEAEDQLKAEIGRLNAKVAQLESELKRASTSKPSVFSEAFKKQLGTSLGDWKLYAALCGGLWIVSGDTAGMQRRLENIAYFRDAIFGEVSPSPQGTPASAHVPAEGSIEICPSRPAERPGRA